MSATKIDKTGLQIVRLLQNGRRSFKEIGLELGLSEATIRSKVAKMIQEGLMDIKALVSTKNLEAGHQTAYIGVRLKSPSLKEMAERVSSLPGVISVAVVTGRYDLILTIMLTPDFTLIDFFDAMLERPPEGIISNETVLVYEEINLKVPYPF